MSTATAKPTRMRPVFILTLIILLVATAVALRSRSQPDRMAASLAAIEQSLDAQREAWKNGNLDGFMDAYWESDELILITGDTHLAGCQATFQHYQERYQANGQEMGLLTLKGPIQMLDSRNALVWGEWQVVTSSQKRSGRFSRVYKKLPSGWRIIHENTTM